MIIIKSKSKTVISVVFFYLGLSSTCEPCFCAAKLLKNKLQTLSRRECVECRELKYFCGKPRVWAWVRGAACVYIKVRLARMWHYLPRFRCFLAVPSTRHDWTIQVQYDFLASWSLSCSPLSEALSPHIHPVGGADAEQQSVVGLTVYPGLKWRWAADLSLHGACSYFLNSVTTLQRMLSCLTDLTTHSPLTSSFFFLQRVSSYAFDIMVCL